MRRLGTAQTGLGRLVTAAITRSWVKNCCHCVEVAKRIEPAQTRCTCRLGWGGGKDSPCPCLRITLWGAFLLCFLSLFYFVLSLYLSTLACKEEEATVVLAGWEKWGYETCLPGSKTLCCSAEVNWVWGCSGYTVAWSLLEASFFFPAVDGGQDLPEWENGGLFLKYIKKAGERLSLQFYCGWVCFEGRGVTVFFFSKNP